VSQRQQPAYPVFCFEGQKLQHLASNFLLDIKLTWKNLTSLLSTWSSWKWLHHWCHT